MGISALKERGSPTEQAKYFTIHGLLVFTVVDVEIQYHRRFRAVRKHSLRENPVAVLERATYRSSGGIEKKPSDPVLAVDGFASEGILVEGMLVQRCALRMYRKDG
jgi:hypothetical protein